MPKRSRYSPIHVFSKVRIRVTKCTYNHTVREARIEWLGTIDASDLFRREGDI